MAWFFHSNHRLVMAGCACASPVFTSFIDVPSLACAEPNYFNWSTSSSLDSLIHMPVDGLGLTLTTIILLLWELISMPYPATVSSSLSVSC